MIVVADTSPPLHLARIGRLDLIPAVVGRVLVPRTVWKELVQAGTRPDVVAALESAAWIEVVQDPPVQDLGLDAGETAAILLAEQLRADALLIDERDGRAVALARGIAVIGTLGIVAGGPSGSRLPRRTRSRTSPAIRAPRTARCQSRMWSRSFRRASGHSQFAGQIHSPVETLGDVTCHCRESSLVGESRLRRPSPPHPP